jgi:hypothetical protein
MLFLGHALLFFAHWATGCNPSECTGLEDMESRIDAADKKMSEGKPACVYETSYELTSETGGTLASDDISENAPEFMEELASDPEIERMLDCTRESAMPSKSESTPQSTSCSEKTITPAKPGSTPSTLSTITVATTEVVTASSSNARGRLRPTATTTARPKKPQGPAHMEVSSFLDPWCGGRVVDKFTMKENQCVAFPGPQMPGALTNDDPAIRYRIDCYHDATCFGSMTGNDARSASGVCSHDYRVGSCKLFRL